MRRGVAVAAGLLADRAFGEPALPAGWHPVSLFGRAMRAVESRAYADARGAGVVHCGAGVGLGLAAGSAVRSTALAVYVSTAGRALGDAALAVGAALSSGDLEGARSLLPALVGRDPSDLDEKEVARAAVESVAENTVDAVVAPALWAVAGGAPGALAYRAVNTMDSVVGHRSPRYQSYGWASARLDDAAGWVPARVTAGLVAAARPRAAKSIWRAVRTQAGGHPSPNAGVAEAAFAAALGLRLGGVNRYGERVEVRPHLGEGRPAEAADIAEAVRLLRDVTLLLAGAVAVLA